MQLVLSNKALDCGQYILQYLPIVLDNELEYGEFFYNILLLPLPPNAKAYRTTVLTHRHPSLALAMLRCAIGHIPYVINDFSNS